MSILFFFCLVFSLLGLVALIAILFDVLIEPLDLDEVSARVLCAIPLIPCLLWSIFYANS